MIDPLRHGLGGAGTAAPGASWPTVLVIDDEASVRESLEILLESYGFQVVLARNGRQGLATFRRIEPDLVLTDIIMPVQDGIETILKMRQERPDARILGMSGSGSVGNSDYPTIATKLGADAALEKPFDGNELIDAVRALIATERRPLEESRAA